MEWEGDGWNGELLSSLLPKNWLLHFSWFGWCTSRKKSSLPPSFPTNYESSLLLLIFPPHLMYVRAVVMWKLLQIDGVRFIYFVSKINFLNHKFVKLKKSLIFFKLTATNFSISIFSINDRIKLKNYLPPFITSFIHPIWCLLLLNWISR